MGSNIGDRLKFVNEAINGIKNIGTITKQSSFYKSDAWGNINQDYFINCAVSVNTKLSAEEVLNKIHEIEKQLGRERKIKWEPRTIDIDILFFNDEIIKTPALEVPHPEFTNRKFAIIPMLEIEKDFVHPINKMKIDNILAACTDTGSVSIYKN